MEQWNNVELSDLSKKSYTLNHAYDLASKTTNNNDNNGGDCSTQQQQDSAAGEGAGAVAVAADANVPNGDNDVLQPGSDIKPKVNLEGVEALARRLYGITTSDIKELISYDDRNYLIHEDRNIKNPIIVSRWPHGYVLKILNALDSKKTDFVEAQNELMIYLSEQQIQCSRPIANVNGKYFSVERISGADHVVRLLEFIPGKIFHQVSTVSNYLLYQSGEYLAKINRALKNFTHEAYETRKSLWMLQSIPQLKEFIYVLEDHTRKSIVEEIIAAFETNVLSQLDTFEKQIIHGDYNEQNIIVEQLPQQPEEHKVSGIIDFGDTNQSPIIFEIGIAMTYMMLQAKSIASGGVFLAGYEAVRPISTTERQCLKYCVAARLAQSLTLGFYTYTLNPSNDYVLVTQAQGWQMLEELWRENFATVDELWQTTMDQYLTQSGK